MESHSLNTEELIHASLPTVRKAMRQIITSPCYKLIKADNAYQVFRILMTDNTLSCVIYCSFFVVDSVRIKALFKVSNVSNENLLDQELINLRTLFIAKFTSLIEANPVFKRSSLNKEIQQNVNPNFPVATAKVTIQSINKIKPSHYISKKITKQPESNYKGLWVLFWIVIILLAIALSNSGKTDHVSGYDKSNGTHVNSYSRKP